MPVVAGDVLAARVGSEADDRVLVRAGAVLGPDAATDSGVRWADVGQIDFTMTAGSTTVDVDLEGV